MCEHSLESELCAVHKYSVDVDKWWANGGAPDLQTIDATIVPFKSLITKIRNAKLAW